MAAGTAVNLKLPVEIEMENEKLYKMEIELETLLQVIENQCESKAEFDKSMLTARAVLASLKKSYNKFSGSICEWEDDPLFEEKIKPLVETHRNVLQSTQTNFQRSCLNGQKRLEHLEKSSLLTSSTDFGADSSPASDSKVRQRKLQKSEIANKNQEITRDLQKIARMMDSQVKRGEESNEILESSSQQIREVHEEYKGMTGFISVARKLLNKYNRRELTDNLLMFFGLLLFFATVIYIVSKRI